MELGHSNLLSYIPQQSCQNWFLHDTDNGARQRTLLVDGMIKQLKFDTLDLVVKYVGSICCEVSFFFLLYLMLLFFFLS